MLRHIESRPARGLPTIGVTAVATFGWLCLLASITPPVLAAPISYAESVSGDLPDGSPLVLFTLDVGVNTVSGKCGSFGVNDFDSFAFIVPPTLQVTSGQVVMTDAEGEFLSSAWSLGAGSAEPFGGTSLGGIVSLSPGSANFPVVPLGPNTYNITHGTFTTIGAGGMANYTFTIVVVPEPTSAALLALMGLALSTRYGRRDSRGAFRSPRVR